MIACILFLTSIDNDGDQSNNHASIIYNWWSFLPKDVDDTSIILQLRADTKMPTVLHIRAAN